MGRRKKNKEKVNKETQLNLEFGDKEEMIEIHTPNVNHSYFKLDTQVSKTARIQLVTG